MANDREELLALRRMAELEDKAAKSDAANKPGYEKFIRGLGDRASINVDKLENLGRSVIGLPTEGTSYSTEKIREHEAKAKPIADTGAGLAGNIAGDILSLAPLGGIGAGMEAAAGAARTPQVLRATLASRPAQAITEGALAGTMTADPEARGQGAMIGAGAGLVGERLGAGLGRVVRGLVKKSPEAKALEEVADLHSTEVKLPLSIAASDEGLVSPFMKFVYGKVLPNLPGAEGALKRQGEKAAQQYRGIVLKEAAPGGMGRTTKGYAAGLPESAGANVRMTMKDIQDAFEREYADTIKSYSFNSPKPGDLSARLRQRFPNIDDATVNGAEQTTQMLLDRYSKKGIIDGDNLIRAKTALADLGRSAGDDRTGQAFYQAQEMLDDVVRNELRVGGKKQNLVDLQRYEGLAEPWRNFLRVQKAAARTKDPVGEFTPQDLSRAVKAMSGDRELAAGGAPMQELASLGERTVGKPLHQPSYLERALTLGTLGGLGAVGGGPAGMATMWGAGRAAASPVVQDTLMGGTAIQKALTEALRKNPRKAQMTGAAVRNVLAGEASNDVTEQ